jgi:hypothetical protein
MQYLSLLSFHASLLSLVLQKLEHLISFVNRYVTTRNGADPWRGQHNVNVLITPSFIGRFSIHEDWWSQHNTGYYIIIFLTVETRHFRREKSKTHLMKQKQST